MGSKQSVLLEDITVQYWFNGPEGIELDPASSPNLLFQLVCSDATTGAAADMPLPCSRTGRRSPLAVLVIKACTSPSLTCTIRCKRRASVLQHTRR